MAINIQKNKEKLEKRRENLIKMRKNIQKQIKINKNREIKSLEYSKHHYID